MVMETHDLIRHGGPIHVNGVLESKPPKPGTRRWSTWGRVELPDAASRPTPRCGTRPAPFQLALSPARPPARRLRWRSVGLREMFMLCRRPTCRMISEVAGSCLNPRWWRRRDVVQRRESNTCLATSSDTRGSRRTEVSQGNGRGLACSFERVSRALRVGRARKRAGLRHRGWR
jgi:hypothetical protein